MQLTHRIKQDCVAVTLIVALGYRRGDSIQLHLADGRVVRVDHWAAAPGNIFVQHLSGDYAVVSKCEFDRHYEAIAQSEPLRTGGHPPAEVIAAAHLVGRYFTNQNIGAWELGPCKARFPRDHNHGKQCAPLDGILVDLRAKRDKAPGPIRREYNDICDRIGVLNSLEAQLASAAGSWHDFDIHSSLLDPRELFLVRRAPGRDPAAVNGASV